LGGFYLYLGEEQLIRDLRTNVKAGILSNSLKEREIAFGHNRKPVANLKSLMTLFIESLDDFTLKILIVAAIVSISIKFMISRLSNYRRRSS
jgi:magnesium-transporting ATPase (P-type)